MPWPRSRSLVLALLAEEQRKVVEAGVAAAEEHPDFGVDELGVRRAGDRAKELLEAIYDIGALEGEVLRLRSERVMIRAMVRRWFFNAKSGARFTSSRRELVLDFARELGALVGQEE